MNPKEQANQTEDESPEKVIEEIVKTLEKLSKTRSWKLEGLAKNADETKFKIKKRFPSFWYWRKINKHFGEIYYYLRGTYGGHDYNNRVIPEHHDGGDEEGIILIWSNWELPQKTFFDNHKDLLSIMILGLALLATLCCILFL